MKTFSNIANAGVGELSVYEPGRPIEEVARSLGFDDPDDIIKLASNENPVGVSHKAVVAMQAAASQMYRYPDGGAYNLKRAIAEKLDLSEAEILPVNGSNEALELLGHVFLGAETGIVMAEYAFAVYRLIAAAAGAAVVSVPMHNFTHDLDAMLDAIRPETKIVFISNPNNPTGTMVDESAIVRFMDRVPDHVVVCFDEAYIELLPPERQPDVLKYVRDGRNVIVLRTFSKTYGLAGLRIGYVIAPEECIQLLNRVRQPFNVNAMAMTGAIAALGDDDHVDRTREVIADGLEYLQGEFERIGLSYVSAVANFILVETIAVSGMSGRVAFEALQKKGVIVRPMDGYGLPGYIRVTIGLRSENEVFIRSLCSILGL